MKYFRTSSHDAEIEEQGEFDGECLCLCGEGASFE